ncbi:MAG: cytochrome c maturation protein CcmE [Gammaproteobacteria bacterium]|nr:cytochrome c maturation protein CcmE [Gammaproteobacteria bacterium]MDH3372567.1 cytochrome c maturation protein CcmE [Gammaproteobacteria bacterium]MDH3408849.1 cytochrome c maturation protein CcmE [Gammaproteobacteria bacterium]
MKPRQQRMLAVGLVVIGVAIATGLSLQAMKDSMMFFVSVTEVAEGKYPENRNFRVGGLVRDGSVQRDAGSLEMTFKVTDLRCDLDVSYSGVLPDLFREGQGVVAHGRLEDNGVFVADEILAKHDENYMAPEVADSMADHVTDQTAGLSEGPLECPSQ